MHRLFTQPVVALAAVALLIGTTACGSDDSSDGEVFAGVTVTGEPGEKPEVSVDDLPFTVDETSTEVVDEGDGDEVAEGDSAVLQYLGVNGRTGKEFNSSWVDNGGEPVTFPLQQGQLIPGFLDGLVGQTYGSRVAIAITPDDGYGPSGGNPQIGVEADDTLIFVVDLIEADTAAQPQGPPAAPDDALEMAEGEPRQPPAGLPELELDGSDQPTGFAADGSVPKSVDELVAAPVIVGDGPTLAEDDTVFVEYVGQLWPDGKVFDESWSEEGPASFALTRGGLIDGFLDGLIGQRVGSRVVIAIPSDQGYGKQGAPPDIPPDADLVFVVDILAKS